MDKITILKIFKKFVFINFYYILSRFTILFYINLKYEK